MTISKIITDNDGVNIDSEDLAMRIMDDEGKKLIGDFHPALLNALPEDQIYKAFAGTSTDKIVKALIEGDWRVANEKEGDRDSRRLPLIDIAERHGLLNGDMSIETVSTHIADLITIATINRFENDLKSIPGTTEAWTELRDMLGADSLALATTSRGDRMDVSVNHAVDPKTGDNAKLSEFFNEGARRFSGYGTPNKYDAFFAQSGWKPEDCAIVEDSLSGVKYAKSNRPEVKVVGTVAANFYPDKAAHAAALTNAGADIVISTMHDLPKAVRWLNDGMAADKKPDFAGQVFTPAKAAESPSLPAPGMR